MKITIGVQFEIHDVDQLDYFLGQIAGKSKRQFWRAPGCICTHAEIDDLIYDPNGNRVGTISVIKEKGGF